MDREFIEEQIKYLEESIELREYGLKEDKWKLNRLKKDLEEQDDYLTNYNNATEIEPYGVNPLEYEK